MSVEIQYGELRSQRAMHKVTHMTVQAQAGAQSWSYQEAGLLGGLTYRVVVKQDFSYATQGRAHLDIWGQNGFNELIVMYGTDVDEFLQPAARKRFREPGEINDFSTITAELLSRAAATLFLRS